MAKFMKLLNNISRSNAIFRKGRVSAEDLQPSQYIYVQIICNKPGRTQDEIANEICVNKSTAARNLNALEEKGYVERIPKKNDKRCLSVYPTEKMQKILPEIRAASGEWSAFLSQNIPEEEFEIFRSVLERMEARAREITGIGDNEK